MGNNGSCTRRMEEMKNETADLEDIPIDDVFKQLNCSRRGLTTAEGMNRLQIFGLNQIKERKESHMERFRRLLCPPSPRSMQIAALLGVILVNSIGDPWDGTDNLLVLVMAGLMLFQVLWYNLYNSVGDDEARRHIAGVMAGTASKTKVLRDGEWRKQDAAILVPGDIISIKCGDIVHADARLLEGDCQLTIGQSAITGGASLPVSITNKPGAVVFSGSTCKQGEAEAVVIATGVHTFSGKAARPVADGGGGSYAGRITGASQVDVLRSTGNFCMCCVAIGIAVEIMATRLFQNPKHKVGIRNNIFALLVGAMPVAAPVVAAMSAAYGKEVLFLTGAIAKRTTAIEKMAGMDVLYCDKTGTLTLNKPVIEKNLIEVFAKDVDKERAILLAARASRTDNHDPIDAAIVGMLADPKEARAGIKEVHFQPFNLVDRRTALTYIDCDGNWHRVSKGDPEKILNLCRLKEDVGQKVRLVIDKFAERGLWSLGVACQQVLEKNKDMPGQPWQFVALLGLFDPPMLDSVEAIRMARNLGVDVKLITGDELVIAKETGRRVGMGENMYLSSILMFGQDKDASTVALPMVDKLIEKADGFAGVLPEHKCMIVERLQRRKHICGMTGDGVNDALALVKADIGISVAGASDAAISASDIVLTKPGLNVIVSAVLTSRAILWTMKSYTIHAVSIAFFTLLCSMLVTLIWGFDFPGITHALFATYVLHLSMIIAMSLERVRPSPHPESWSTKEVLANGIGLGAYSALTTVIFFWATKDTDFFTDMFPVRSLRNSEDGIRVALCLQTSTLAQALILVTRSRSWFFVERPGLLFFAIFVWNQLATTAFLVYYRDEGMKGIEWGWAGVIWLYNVVVFFPLDWIKFAIRYILSTGRTWDNLLENKTAFTVEEDSKYRGGRKPNTEF